MRTDSAADSPKAFRPACSSVVRFGEIPPVLVSEGGLEPPCPLRALAPQASASAYSATRTQLAAVWTGPSRITIANHGTWCEAQDSYRVNTAPTQPKEA